MTTGLPTADGAATRRVLLLDLLRARRGAVAVVIVLFAGATAVTLVGPRLLGNVIDEVTGGQDRGVIDAAAAAFLVVTVLGAALTYLAEARAGVVGEDMLASLRARLFTRTVTLPLATAERAGTGELLARMIGDVAALATAVRYAVPSMVLAAVELVLTAAALVLLSPPLAAATLVGLPLGVVAGRWYLRRSPGVYRGERERTAEVTTELHESFGGAATVAAHRLGPARLASLRAAGAAAFTASMRGAVTLGAITAAAFYVLRLVGPINVLMEFLDRLQTANAGLARIAGVLDLPDPPAAAPSPARDGTAVSLRGVRFGYLPGQPVLHGINLDVRAGERLALVGPSGAGKSTLAALVAAVHRPEAGTITVAGDVVLLTQQAHTFLGTVADNLRLVAPGASERELRNALATVGAGQWVNALPDGLATRVGADGYRLPAAAHQQLALARLVLADPAIVVLDEATADFGSAAARDLDRSLNAALAGRTVIAIAHRLHAAAAADRVAVLEDGRIIELGSHSELLSAAGSYAALWQRWVHHRSAV